MGDLRLIRLATAATLCVICAAATDAFARPTPQGQAWIDTCIAARKDDRLADAKRPRHTAAQIRSYCKCIHEFVEDNRPYTISELEHSFPPAHEMCLRKAAKSGKAERWRICGARRTMAVSSEEAAQASGTPRCVPLR